ncbi:3-oxoacyl-ACP synthase III family protein [Lentzea sp. JNUCC 0626]|uniref:3-oxoacyl-ACP synthase III family protein n=1 Tax=Lentzea sp. JNUCC 0626 TaxID=3367513 RepID=UPI00374A4ABC
MSSSVGVLGTGSCLPDRVVTNEEIADLVPGATPEWILSRTGISTRRWARPEQATSDLAAVAAARALRRAGVPPDRITHLILATSTGDHPQPPTSCLVQDLIGARAAACVDVNAVCAGFVYALDLARSLVATRPGAIALVIGADVYSRILDLTDRRTAVLMGDGAGAAVVGEVPEPGVLDSELISFGESHDLIKVEAGGSRVPTTADTVAAGLHHFTMRGRDVRDFVMNTLPPLLDEVVGRAGLTYADISCFVPHQANAALLRALTVHCGLKEAQAHITADRYGNLGSASVPVALDDAVRSGRIRTGDLVLLAGFGGGMSVGTALLRWTA